ncbi:hypothetical protein AXG53_12955 [Stenotrophomonas sp. KCTC 12332]|nr:hypothetical protein AXG53_12955 [Stenotrophomonas sp. KCTC 12332]
MSTKSWAIHHAFRASSPAGVSIAYTQRSSVLAIEQRVVSPEVQGWIVEEQAHRDGSQLVTLRCLTQLFIQRVQHPALTVLYLASEGELIVLFWQPLAIALYYPAD